MRLLPGHTALRKYHLDNHLGPRAHHEAPPDARPPHWPSRLWSLLQRLGHRLGFATRRRFD